MKWALVATIVAATTVGYLFQALGMRDHGEVREFHLGALSRSVCVLAGNKWIVLSIAALALSFFSFMALLSMADLSFAVPATALSIVLETILARLVLKESVDWKRWLGAAFVALGVALLA